MGESIYPRASRIIEAVIREIKRHERAIEADLTIRKIEIQVRIGERTGDPVKIGYATFSENDLTRRG